MLADDPRCPVVAAHAVMQFSADSQIAKVLPARLTTLMLDMIAVEERVKCLSWYHADPEDADIADFTILKIARSGTKRVGDWRITKKINKIRAIKDSQGILCCEVIQKFGQK